MPPTERPKEKPAEQAFRCLPRGLIREINMFSVVETITGRWIKKK
jgi:hypothetical protein